MLIRPLRSRAAARWIAAKDLKSRCASGILRRASCRDAGFFRVSNERRLTVRARISLPERRDFIFMSYDRFTTRSIHDV